MQYYFILGKNPILSRAEVQAVLASKGIRIENSELMDKIYFVETSVDLDIDWLNSRLGGTVKIGKILASMADLAEFEELFFKLVKFGESKFFYGFSLYPLTPKTNIPAIQKKLNIIAMEIKSKLRDQFGLSSRYVVSKEPELSSVIVQKNKLLKNGAEICFFIKQGQVLMGQTLAVQEFEEFGARDFDRPGRDQVSGMLPPKLARMMINLAQVNSDAIILDPFCGSGTIIQEAIVLGYKNITGTDNSTKAVEDTKQNLAWLEKQLSYKVEGYKVESMDVRELDNNFKTKSFDAIVTEPYLGPGLKGNERPAEIEATAQQLEFLYLSAFEQFSKVLKPEGKVVIIFPIFKIKNFQRKIDILSQIAKLGFKKMNKEDLLYYRENQFVWREIEIFQK